MAAQEEESSPHMEPMAGRPERSTEVPPEFVAELLEMTRTRSMARVGRSISERALVRSRVASSLVAFAVVVLGHSIEMPLARLLAVLLFPLATVWFPDAIARGTGWLSAGAVVRRPSPASWVLSAGWVVLAITFAAVLVAWLRAG